MPQSERRLYEPSEDVRFFDGGQDEFDEEGSRLPLLIVIAVVVLASFAGVVWLAYTQGVQRGREDAPRILAEQHGRGFATNPYSELQIYKQRNPQTTSEPSTKGISPSSVAMPRPQPSEQNSAPSTTTTQKTGPAARPKPIAAPDKPATIPQQLTPAAIVPKSSSGTSLAPAASGTSRSAAPGAASYADGVSPASGTQAKPVIAPNGKPSTVVQPGPPQQLAHAPEVAPGSTLVLQGGGYLLQIGSYTSAAEASASWQTYKGAHPSVAGYAPDVQQADLGKKGTWYRLRVGPFSTMAEAGAACAKLKAQGGTCFPAKR
ncbi:MAG: SPOR domain-containing protein [Alphaproteobacteria bacterium]|nr:SPOR domain-containing protein [Alphaproteobacteria bacterium]